MVRAPRGWKREQVRGCEAAALGMRSEDSLRGRVRLRSRCVARTLAARVGFESASPVSRLPRLALQREVGPPAAGRPPFRSTRPRRCRPARARVVVARPPAQRNRPALAPSSLARSLAAQRPPRPARCRARRRRRARIRPRKADPCATPDLLVRDRTV
ncbi:hypothetical protein AMAG_17976 [Allomyces macrogynus ATCC 38327]|uniref:Uncharacterized protein n=1 Tax=Allomyces macrogynus (strain ATCC 38327) TaxID=578462 RepID=A0A0L0S340_ALLM3|nr:hypothetical protein AMAG_17976 [Allomyces macrogynus ATCC 38327]|eukprot:KNE56831.1 hypothetical protein AMAG_17976 [Allomyces macrogynus ATCC 38327]